MMLKGKTNLIILLCLIIVLVSQIAQFRRFGQDTIVISVPPITPWVKQDVLIEMKSGKGLDVWTDNVETDIRKINEIDGVINTILLGNGHMIYVLIDPRYDRDLVAKAIAKRLISRENFNGYSSRY